MSKKDRGTSRRGFLGSTALAAAGAATAERPQEAKAIPAIASQNQPQRQAASIQYPRVFTGSHLKMIAFPLGGVAAGSVSLGGRGQLRDWEIFNRPDKGNNLSYALPAIYVKPQGAPAVARVLEARYEVPYEGQDGLGSANAPGLSRLASARFTGQYPLARIDFEDNNFPVLVSLEAFSPFIPHDPDNSGLPVAILRYQVSNRSRHPASVSIAWSIENPVRPNDPNSDSDKQDGRVNAFRTSSNLSGLFMTNPSLVPADIFHGSFALATRSAGAAKVTYLRGWPKGRWWNSPLLFWDDFSSDGELGPETETPNAVGALCLSHDVPGGQSADFEFLLAWHFPNRTPARCGWTAPPGDEHTVIGNWYSTRFPDAWEAAEYAASNLEDLERRTRSFGAALRESTLPPAVLDAVSANLSTLASTVCFRTADGEFHGFEGADDKIGCCFGNCTHVWNYETATAHLFPSFARSLRKSSFGYSMDDAGAMHFRQLLPDGKGRSGFAAADGQMGQIVHAYLDWILSGDREWLQSLWPRIKKAVSFAWIPGGWDANRDGVMEGVQHNTYDVEFYGPNPQCGIYYLAALRAAEEMARVVGDGNFADDCRKLFESGRNWIDQNLFNGEYYFQQVTPHSNDEIAPALRGDMGAQDSAHPEYQVGKGCLADQMIGQYLADVCGLGPLLAPDHIHKALSSVYKYNHKRTLTNHDCVQRTYVLNDESALLICDYATSARPKIPFPYFAEAWTGIEYAVAAHMLFAGMTQQGLECITDVRARYDGERRNPWDEPECGHHYARAMSSWSTLLALSGFRYDGGRAALTVAPALRTGKFQCFWSTGTGWGTFIHRQSPESTRVELHVLSGDLAVKNCAIGNTSGSHIGRVLHNRAEVPSNVKRAGVTSTFELQDQVQVKAGEQLSFEVLA